jgi:hypothetical protein
MRLDYYRHPAGNFRDDLNPWLWPRILPVPMERCFDDDTLSLGAGSLRNHTICDALHIDPTDDVERTIATIRSARVLIAEALHGAIMADTARAVDELTRAAAPAQ